MEKGIEFEIVGDHPHKGERCTLRMTVSGKVSIDPYGGVLVNLIDCPHKIAGCSVPRENLKRVK